MGKPVRPGTVWRPGRKAPWQPLLAVGKVGPRTSRQRYEFRHPRTSPLQFTSLYRQPTSPLQCTSPHQRTSRQWYELHPRPGAAGQSAPVRPGFTAAVTPLAASPV
ncbi:hypothetical protein Sviol_48020 [Streptomyces violascens]|uniref:Uncharacterized protein n=1 Tax=Streptomyces violascens TaxID=67381 RepID=A0ABQ3QSX8_9ACTN|nr:hypothetical protein Sviol_48020 [Streptomyces violascens]